MTFKRQSILPGFWPAFSYTVLYLSLIVLIPLSAVFLKSGDLRLGAFLASDPRRRTWWRRIA